MCLQITNRFYLRILETFPLHGNFFSGAEVAIYNNYTKISTLICLSIGTPKNNKFCICSKWKTHYFQVSQNLGILEHVITMSFPFETNGKLMILGVPILQHFRVFITTHNRD